MILEAAYSDKYVINEVMIDLIDLKSIKVVHND